MRAMTRKELAAMAGVSTRTFGNWMRQDPVLKALPNRALIPPNIVRYICEKYCITIDN